MISVISLLAIATDGQLDATIEATLRDLRKVARIGSFDELMVMHVYYDLAVQEEHKRQGQVYGWSGGSLPPVRPE